MIQLTVQDISPLVATTTVTRVPEPLVTVRHFRLEVEPAEDQPAE